jgi:heat shock protein HslJ
MKQFMSFLFLFLMIISCDAKKKQKNVQPEQKISGEYILISQKDETQLIAIVSPKGHVSIDMSKKHLDASVGCNSIGGEIINDRKKVSFTNLIQTEMFCDESLNRIELTFLNHLQNIDEYKFNSKNELEFIVKKEVVIVLKKTK